MSKFMAPTRPAEKRLEAQRAWSRGLAAWPAPAARCSGAQPSASSAFTSPRPSINRLAPQNTQNTAMQKLIVSRPHVLSVSVKCSEMQRLHTANMCNTDPDQTRPSNPSPRLAPPYHQEGSDACRLTWTPGDPLGLPGILHRT